MLIVQFSDMHIKPEGAISYGRIDTSAYLRDAVAHIAALRPRPDLALATGDLVDGGAREEYARLAALLDPLDMPVYLIPGNHDSRDALRESFPEHRYLPASGFLQYAVDVGALRLIALDTLVPGAGHGELCDERLDWLEARLAEHAGATILFMHHPPIEIGMAMLDAMRLNAGRERLEALVRAHGGVERILCGHVHRPTNARWAGTVVSTVPSTAHQLTLDLRPDADFTYTLDPPAVALHRWSEGAGLVSHLSFVGPYDGPHSFYGAAKN
jgi:Icc protein